MHGQRERERERDRERGTEREGQRARAVCIISTGEIGMHDMHGAAAKLTRVGLSPRFPASKSRLRELQSKIEDLPAFQS